MISPARLLLRIDNAAPSPVLAHERTLPHRTDRVLAAWKRAGHQQTPLAAFEPEPGAPLIVADGHHRLAAAQLLARTSGCPIELVAEVQQPSIILPAHKLITAAPAGWLDACHAQLRQTLAPHPRPTPNGVTLAWRDGEAHFHSDGLPLATLLNAVWEAAQLSDPQVVWEIEGDASRACKDRAHLAAILVPAVTLQDVIHAAHTGQLLPPRSTNFQPKLEQGSINHPLPVHEPFGESRSTPALR